MNIFPCTVEKCGRKFNKKDELKEHYVRRHSGHISSNSINPQKNPLEQQQHSETTLNLKANKILLPEHIKSNIKKPLMIPTAKKNPNYFLKPNSFGKTAELKPSENKETKDFEEKNRIKNTKPSLCEEKSRENTTTYSVSFNKEENFVGNLVDVNYEKQDFENLLKDDTSDIEIIDSPEKNEKVDLSEIMASKQKLTEEYIMKKSSLFEKIEQITTLILRDENLYVFESHDRFQTSRFISLEYLCLSHNKLFNVHGIGECVNLIELNVSFNHIEDIYPLKNCRKLEKLFLSNNKISDIKPLADIKTLKVVSLYKNKLRSLDEIVLVFQQLPKIDELDLDANPATRKYLYKYDILYSIQLTKLDGEYVSEIDYELAKNFKKERVSKAKNFDDPSLQRPSTAPGKIRNHFLGGDNTEDQKKYSERFKDKIGKLAKEAHKFLNDIPEAEDIPEKYYEMEQELEVVKGERNQLRKELEEIKSRENELNLKIKNLEAELLMKQVEANSAYILTDENKSLRNKLKVYEEVMSDDNKPESVYLQKIFVAHLKIDELLSENMRLQAQIDPKPAKEQKIKPDFYKTFSHFPKAKEDTVKPFLGGLQKTFAKKNTNLSPVESKTEKVEEDFKKNSHEIEKLKNELRMMMESVDEENHDNSFGDNNIFDPEI